MLMGIISAEFINGVIGAIVGAIAAFALGLGREFYKEHRSKSVV